MIKCTATKCVHNKKFKCYATKLNISKQKCGVICSNYSEIPNYNVRFKNYSFPLPYEDAEFSKEFFENNDIICSCEECIFNVHYLCKARIVNIAFDKNKALCKTHYGI